MKNKLYILFILSVATLTYSCKKYPEDKNVLHLRTINKRLYGKWEVTSYEVNRIDSTTSFKNNLNNYCQFEFIERPHLDSFQVLKRYMCGSTINYFSNNSDWYFYGEKRNVIRFSGIGGATGLIKGSTYYYPINWQIIQLDYTKMKLLTSYDGNEYIVELSK